jgi:hypothetical protein
VRHGPSTFAPIEIGLSGRDAPGVGLRRREDGSVQANRWPKAFAPIEIGLPGATRRASASADAKNALPVGAGRPLAEGLLAD